MTVMVAWSVMARTRRCALLALTPRWWMGRRVDAHFAVVVGSVVAQPVVAGVADGGGESRLRCGGVGHRRGEPLQRPVGSKLVVDVLEAVELGLQLVQGGGGGLSGEPALQGEPSWLWWRH